MIENDNQSIVCVGQMPIRALDGTKLEAVPIYKIVSSDDMSVCGTVNLAPDERLVQVGVMESKAEAEKRYNTLIAGGTPPKTHATPLYIKENVNNTAPKTGLTWEEKKALNPLVTDMLKAFSAAMRKIDNDSDVERE